MGFIPIFGLSACFQIFGMPAFLLSFGCQPVFIILHLLAPTTNAKTPVTSDPRGCLDHKRDADTFKITGFRATAAL